MKLYKIDDFTGVGIKKNLTHPDQEAFPKSPPTSKSSQITRIKTPDLVHDHMRHISSEENRMPRQVTGTRELIVKATPSRLAAESTSTTDYAGRFDRGGHSSSGLLSPLHSASILDGASAIHRDGLRDGAMLGTLWEKVDEALKELVRQEPKESPLFHSTTNILNALKNLTFSESNPHASDFFRFFLEETGQTLSKILLPLTNSPGYSHSDSAQEVDPLASMFQKLIDVASQSPESERIRPFLQQILEWTSTLRDSMKWDQVLNSLTYLTNDELFFHIPFCINTSFLTGYLYLKLNCSSREKKRNGRNGMMVVFFLDLQDLGGVRVDAGFDSHNRVSICIYMENRDALAFVQGRLPDFAQALSREGVRVGHIAVVKARRIKLEEFCRKEPLSGFLQGHIDLRL